MPRCMPRCMVQVGLPASLLQMVFLEGSVIIKLFIEGARSHARICAVMDALCYAQIQLAA